MEKEKINDTQSGLGYLLRIGATDLCNNDCIFCHPPKVKAKNVLTTEQLLEIAQIIYDNYKLKTIHFTGGEPLLRRDIVDLVKGCQKITNGEIEMAMTTNAQLLPEKIEALADAGIKRLNVSLHSINPEKYQQLTNSKGELVEKVKLGMTKARDLGIKVKANCIVIKGITDTDMGEITSYCWNEGIIPRFLELGLYGPVAEWFTKDQQMPHDEILAKMNDLYVPFKLDPTRRGNGPTKYYINEKGQLFGIVHKQSSNLCVGCDRFRLSSTGLLKACDFPPIDLKEFIDSREELESELLKVRDILKTKGKDYIGKKTRSMDYNFRWNLTQIKKSDK